MRLAVTLFLIGNALIVVGLLTGYTWAYALSVAGNVGAGILATLHDANRENPRSDLN